MQTSKIQFNDCSPAPTLILRRRRKPRDVRMIGIVPFVGLQVVCLAVVWVFPVLATWLPGVLYGH